VRNQQFAVDWLSQIVRDIASIHLCAAKLNPRST